jgi:hypothetical protein
MANGPTLLIFDFPTRLTGAPEEATQLRGLAESIAREPGLLWKIWTEDKAAGRAGGV